MESITTSFSSDEDYENAKQMAIDFAYWLLQNRSEGEVIEHAFDRFCSTLKKEATAPIDWSKIKMRYIPRP